MKKINKILPAIALASAGIAALVGVGNVSAYNYAQVVDTTRNPQDVAVCYTINGITVPVQLTVTITLQKVSTSLNLGAVTLNNTSSANVTYSGTSASNTATITIPFSTSETTSPSGGSVQKCAHLNFGSALARDANFDTHSINVTNIAITGENIDPDDPGSDKISFGYELATDANDEPTMNSSSVYQANYWLKTSDLSYSSSVVPEYGHIEVTKKVKGNAANPDEEFEFKARVYKTASYSGNTYRIVVNGTPLDQACTYASSASDTTHDCTFKLKHGQVAKIGCANSTCANNGQLVRNAVSYTITESNAKGHTPYVDTDLTTSKSYVSGSVNSAKVEHLFTNKKTNNISGRFLTILPFVILAALATVGVITLRKTSKKKEA